MCTKSKKVPAFFWSVLRYYIPSFEKKYEKLHKRATVYSHFLHIYFLFGNIQLANTLSKHIIYFIHSLTKHPNSLSVGSFVKQALILRFSNSFFNSCIIVVFPAPLGTINSYQFSTIKIFVHKIPLFTSKKYLRNILISIYHSVNLHIFFPNLI